MQRASIRLILAAGLGAAALAAVACSSTTPAAPPATATPAAGTTGGAAQRASCTLQPLGQSGVHGTVTFTAVAGGVKVDATIAGLAPNSVHGFHIHTKGDCSAPDGSSAGGHFNPTHEPHGAPGSPDSHVGDLGNLTADAHGVAKLTLVKKGASFSGATNIIGRAVIVHAKADDLVSQPSGAAGPRIACGVIQADSHHGT